MKITKQQIASIHGLLPAGIKYNAEAKGEVVIQFTGCNTKTSTKDLTFQQANELIKRFGGTPHKPTRNKFGFFDKTNQTHKYILSLCRQIGWVTHKQGYGIIPDTDLLGDWLQNTGYLKKPLKDYTPAELPKLVSQFEKVVKNTKL